jgi:endonuclease/exonuclease/phosphatase family metal-dependent hydrolase
MVLCLAVSAANGGMETFANFAYTGNSYATNVFAGQDGSTWTCAAARGDIQINGQAPTLRSNVNAYVQSGTLTGGVGSLTFKYRRPYNASAMNNVVLVIGQNSAYTGMVTELPLTTNDVLTYTASNVNVDGDFTLLITNKAGSARITVDDIEWTGYSANLSAPAFTSGTSQGATILMPAAFTVVATGNPTPTLALQGTTASAGYAFTAGTGQLNYTPPTNDVGTQTFIFTASNGLGVATQIVSVLVAGPPVYVPTVTVTNVGTNACTVNWTEVTDATTYQVQVGTDSNFTGSTSGTNILSQTFATLTATTPPSGWTSSASNNLTDTQNYGAASPSFRFGTSGQWLLSPTFAPGATNLQFWAFSGRSGNSFTISGLVSGAWTQIGTVGIGRNGSTYNVPLDSHPTQIKFSFTRANNNSDLDDVVVQGSSAAGSLLVDETVAALTYGATNLNLLTAYYVRVRATTGTWSTIVQAITLGNNPVVPWFTGGAGPYGTTAGVAVAFAESAMGVPAPVLGLQGATAAAGSYSFTTNTGSFSYTPPVGDAGTQTFTFTASNSTGVATQTVSISVAAATPPAFGALGTQYATTGVNKAFIVGATGVPTPTLALAGTTASSGYTFSPDAGRLSYTPPTNDVGARTFTFTASNLAGTATQVVTVVVSNAPTTPPTVNPIPPQSMLVSNVLNYAVAATPTDGDPILSYACTSAVASATWTFNANSGAFTFTPAASQIGSNAFYFSATDKDGPSASVRMSVIVSTSADPVAVSFGQTRIVGEEGGTSVVIPVKLAYSGSAAVQVRFSGPTNGTARWGTDFTCATNLTIAGASSGEIVVNIVNDYLAEGPESVTVTLVPVAPATAGSSTQAVLYVRDDDTVSIVAANTSTGSQEYEGPGNRIFQALCPDVVLIQEFNMTNGTSEAVYRAWVDQNFGTNFNFYHEPVASASIPNGIISRWPISQTGEWDDATLTDRDFVWAKIDLPGAQPLYAVSVHIKASSGYESQRTTEARALTNYVTQAGMLTNGYVVIGGDLNLQVRTETALQVLTSKVVTDKHQAADQFGDKETNSGRDNPYDNVLPSTNLDARHRTFSFYGYTYTNGLVFDTRLAWANGLPPPALAADSADSAMQHMAVMKVFELEKDATVDAPQAFSIASAGSSQIDLAFAPNALGDDVIVVWNGDGNFTAPTGTAPAVGTSFAGGTVLYKGNVSPQSHAGLTGCSTYYYKCWSYAGTTYSVTGLTATAATTGPDAPGSIWASATNSTGFTATWSAVPGVTDYRLDVATGASFSPTVEFVSGYSNRLVSGATSIGVTGLVPGLTYGFRVRAENGTCQGGNSSAGTATTLKLNQTIVFPAIGAQSTTNAVALSATASSGLAVSYAVASGPAVLTGSTLTFTNAGAVSIVASQAGNGSWGAASSVTNTFTVTKAVASVTLTNLAQTYDGTARAAAASTWPTGLVVDITYDGSALPPIQAGSYAVTGTVNHAMYQGSATGTLVISAAPTPFETWVAGKGQDPGDPKYAPDADDDHDGMTTWEEYLADTDPAKNGSVLAITGQYVVAGAGDGIGRILLSFPASTGRFYQLEYCTDLTNHVIGVSNLGWGVPGMVVTSDAPATWYGVIRAMLAAPPEP